jgi:diguanylate cyclase (GGDEF)-like protein/PAS domain S-box-containing protein
MMALLRSRLAVRTSAVIMAIVAVVGLLFLAVAAPLVGHLEKRNQLTSLQELMKTVERTASIACYLGDTQLAAEIAEGLLGNRTVREVVILAGDRELARRGIAGPGQGHGLVYAISRDVQSLTLPVRSPFAPGMVVGRIDVVPDAAAIHAEILDKLRFVMLLGVVLLVTAMAGAVVTVNRYVTGPISRLSGQLYRLRTATGEALQVPRGHERDEIGVLVADVNAMADDIVNALREERLLRELHEIESRKYRTIFEHADTGIFVVDVDGMLVSGNPAFAALFGLEWSATLVWSALRFSDLCGEHATDVADLIQRGREEGEPISIDIRVGGRPGVPTRWVSIMLSPLPDGNLQGVANDVTGRKQAELAAQELAVTDRLTGLGNRLAFERRLDEMFERSYREPAYRFTLLMLDLDWFKRVNDTHGHKAGDEVLVQVGRRLEGAVRRTDFVGRLGGDEYVVLLHGTREPGVIEGILRKIVDAVDQPIDIGGGVFVQVGTSIGAAIFDDPSLSREELLHRADLAMYAAKQSGRNTLRFWEPRLGRAAGGLALSARGARQI